VFGFPINQEIKKALKHFQNAEVSILRKVGDSRVVDDKLCALLGNTPETETERVD